MDDQRDDRKGGVRFRKLRIAWSVAWSVLAVLLCVLWVRSYWWCDMPEHYQVASANGKLHVRQLHDFTITDVPIPLSPRFGVYTVPAGRIFFTKVALLDGPTIPIWILAVPSIALAVAPWIHQLPSRFSLRTLLIAMTLVAIALGAIVWAANK